jgi:hypothetical protein
MCVRVFIVVSAHTCMSIYICTVFLKKTTRNQLIFVRIDETVRDRFYRFFENRPVKFEIFNPTNWKKTLPMVTLTEEEENGGVSVESDEGGGSVSGAQKR